MTYVVTLEDENKEIASRYKDMLRNSYQTLSKEDKLKIRKAFDFSVEAHKEQRRKTGEPYIYHPIAVAKIVANEIGLGANSICAALLHDVVEDTKVTLDDIERIFKDIIFFLKTKTTKSMHILRFHINEIDLYDQLVEYLYETSNNTNKHYCR